MRPVGIDNAFEGRLGYQVLGHAVEQLGAIAIEQQNFGNRAKQTAGTG
jgi:hypothetical protein